MKCFSLSAFSDECAKSADEQLKSLAELNIGAMELRALNGKNVSVLTEKEVAEFAKRAADCGIKISSVGSPIGKIPLAKDRREHLETAKRILEYAAVFNTPLIRIFSFYLPKGMTRKECFAETVSALGELCELAKPYGVTLCHENEADIYGESPEQCDELLQALPALGCVFDMGNFALGGYTPVKAYEILKRRITYFHIKDGTGEGKILPPGRGEAQISQILSRYKKEIGKPTWVTLEPHLTEFAGLRNLTSQKHDMPFYFETPKDAFFFAAEATKAILKGIEE